MKRTVTVKQLRVLELIYDSTLREGFPPTMTELRDALGVASNQSVLNFLQALERQGYIQRIEGQARSVTILSAGLKLLGKQPLVPFAGESAGGSYIAPSRVSNEWIALPGSVNDQKLRRSSAEFFAVQVYGDSMINAGINDRDILLVAKETEYCHGDIVLAHADEGTTIKRLAHKAGRKLLRPENPAYRDMVFRPDTRIDGKIIFNLTSGKLIS